MAYEASQPLKITLIAAADLSALQYHFVTLNTSGTAEAIDSATADIPVGVLQNKPTSGQECEIVVIGVTKVSLDGTVAAGDLVGPSADGQCDTKAALGSGSDKVVGLCLKGGAVNEIGTALINCVPTSNVATA